MKRFCLIFALLTAWCGAAVAQEDVEETVSLLYRGNVPLAELVAGAHGQGWLVYYLPERGPLRPSLVVQLSKGNTSQVATAQVYDAPEGLNYVPVELSARRVTFAQPLVPTIRMSNSRGRWLTANDKPNYNLDVAVSGPVLATWLGIRWVEGVPRGEASVNILVRDREGDGVPDWDLRRVIPELRGRAFLRTNYAERTCDTPLEFDLGVSPLWPFVARGGAEGYEQPYGQALLMPPIRVDWQRARVTGFGEIVTVRNQNCSYAFYSIPALAIGELNAIDFESPFAFYDLSNEGVGYPNLVLRTDHFPALDPWSTGIDHSDFERLPVPRDYERIRYSWRNAVGDGYWDYKVEVLGFHPYTFETPIADGLARIDAPPYARFPSWVTERRWPVVTFIDTEGNGYRSSEGIYEWSPEEIGASYFLGRQANPRLSAFRTVPEGFRGEYRHSRNLPPTLYLSPVDNRFHLLGADGGFWDAGDGATRVTLGNLAGGLALDHWQVQSPEGRAQLVDLGTYLLFADANSLTLKATGAPRVLTTIKPPSDSVSWRAFRDLAATYEDQKRSAADLESWLTGFDGPTLTVSNMRVDKVQAEGRAVHLEVTVTGETSEQGELELPTLQSLAVGRYLIIFERETNSWTAVPATPPQFHATLDPAPLRQLEPGVLTLKFANTGVLSWSGPVTLGIDGKIVKRWDMLHIAGGERRVESLSWVPPRAGPLSARLRWDDKLVQVPIHVASAPRVGGLQAFTLSALAPAHVTLALLGTLFLSSGFFLWRTWRRV